MSYVARNPFTPLLDESLSPTEFLQLKLKFSIWERQNPLRHEPTCNNELYRPVMGNGMCCVQHLKQCLDGHYLNLAGCRSGVFVMPDGFNNWYDLAQDRLVELLAGQDNLDKWTKLLIEKEEDLYGWIFNSNHIDRNLRPGFSLNSFVIACKKQNFSPNIQDIALAFNFNEGEVSECWNSQILIPTV